MDTTPETTVPNELPAPTPETEPTTLPRTRRAPKKTKTAPKKKTAAATTELARPPHQEKPLEKCSKEELIACIQRQILEQKTAQDTQNELMDQLGAVMHAGKECQQTLVRQDTHVNAMLQVILNQLQQTKDIITLYQANN